MTSDPDEQFHQAMALRDRGQLTDALPLWLDLAEQFPTHVVILMYTAFVKAQLSDYVGAIALFDRVIEQEPIHPTAHHYRAIALQGISQHEKAVHSFEQARQINPLHTITYLHLAESLSALGRWHESLSMLDIFIEHNPTDVQGHYAKGHTLKQLKQWKPALDAFLRAQELDPENWKTYFEVADILQYHEIFETALVQFGKVAKLQPQSPQGFWGMAKMQKALHLHHEALQNSNHALALCSPQDSHYTEYSQLRTELLLDLRQHDLLLAESTQRLNAHPQSVDALTQHGTLLTYLRQFDAAQSVFDQALRLDAESVPAKQAIAWLLHLQGKWQEAYRITSNTNYAANPAFLQSFGKPLWTGAQAVQGKTIVIHAELGHGDTIQLSRFASLVAKQGATVILKVPKSLQRLLSTLEGVSQVVAYEDPTPPCDFVCSMLALPAIFNVLPSAIPYGLQPYLSVKPEWLATIQLPPKTKCRIGLVWGGGYAHYDYRRSVSLQKMMPILQMSNMAFFSFQKDRPRQELASISGLPITDLSEQMQDFADTAALLLQMDLLISVDTSTAHLAGALGKPVWMLTRRDHFWIEGCDDNPWYASMRMYTQTDFGNWDEVMARVQQDLHNFNITL